MPAFILRRADNSTKNHARVDQEPQCGKDAVGTRFNGLIKESVALSPHSSAPSLDSPLPTQLSMAPCIASFIGVAPWLAP
jgi:hypothetical protein